MWGERQEASANDSQPKFIVIKGTYLPAYYSKFSDVIENFKVRDDDIWVCSYPKTGTTWTQEMVWCIANDLDFEGAKVQLLERFPYLEHTCLFDHAGTISRKPGQVLEDWLIDSVSHVANLPSPRFIKSHLPFDLLPREIREGTKNPKIIYITRDPKDACISRFHFWRLMGTTVEDFQDFCSLFLSGQVPYGLFWKHVSSFWSRRSRGNILCLKYEDMKADLASVIRETADFLGKSSQGGWASNNATTEISVGKLLGHLSFESMKANPAVNYEDYVAANQKSKLRPIAGSFLRKGETGQWKEAMTPEMSDEFDRMTRENFGDYESLLP